MYTTSSDAQKLSLPVIFLSSFILLLDFPYIALIKFQPLNFGAACFIAVFSITNEPTDPLIQKPNAFYRAESSYMPSES